MKFRGGEKKLVCHMLSSVQDEFINPPLLIIQLILYFDPYMASWVWSSRESPRLKVEISEP